MVTGEAGIGKTRLAGELARHVVAAGGLVLHGRCDDGVAVAFQPFTEALGTWARRCPTDRLVDQVEGQVPLLARVVPAIADRLDRVDAAVVVPESDSEQHRTFEAVSDLLDGLTAIDDGDVDPATPVLLVVDDLHWAARPTLLLLHHLLRRPSRTPLLIVATYRGTDLTATTPLTDMLGTLHRTERVTTIGLRGLDRAAVREFVELAADHHLDDTIAGFADTLCDQTGGNPFFIATVLAHLAETGAIVRRGERWEAAGDLGAVDLPEGVRRVVGLRLHHIDDTTVETLRTAAVIGTSFSLDLLAELTGHDDDVLLDAMDEAAANGLITETGDRWGTYRFAHDLVRATLVDEVSTTRRIRWHWRIAQALDTATTPDLDLLAYHAHEGVLAGDPAVAADMLHRAAVDADRRSAYDSAVTYATWGLDTLTDLDGHDELRVDLAVTRACALLETGRRVEDPALVDASEHAETAAVTLGDSDRVVQALTLRSRVYPSTDAFVIDRRRIAATRTALDALPDEARTARARLTAFLAHLLVHDTCVDERGRLVDEALGVLDDTTPVEVVDRVLIDCGQALLHPRHTERCRDIATRLANRGSPVTVANGVMLSAITDLVLGNFDTARTRAQLMVQMADDMRLAGTKIVATMILCACADAFGDLDAADQLEATLTDFSPLPARVEPLAAALRNHINYLRVLWAADRTDVDDATRAAVEAGLPETATVWTTPLPWTHLVCGDPQTARAAWEPLRNQPLTDLDHSVATLGDLVAVADLAAAFGNDNERTAAHTALQPYQDWFAGCTSGCFGPIRLYLGKLDLALGRVDDAACHLDVAAELCASRGLDAWLARVDIQRARVALAQGDEQRATELLDGAVATGDAMELPIIAREVAEVREQVG
ncbi:MAG: AAA family ATPase [Acidimicrobiales bacterium]